MSGGSFGYWYSKIEFAETISDLVLVMLENRACLYACINMVEPKGSTDPEEHGYVWPQTSNSTKLLASQVRSELLWVESQLDKLDPKREIKSCVVDYSDCRIAIRNSSTMKRIVKRPAFADLPVDFCWRVKLLTGVFQRVEWVLSGDGGGSFIEEASSWKNEFERSVRVDGS